MRVIIIIMVALIIISASLATVDSAETNKTYEVYVPIIWQCDELTWSGMCGFDCRDYNIFDGNKCKE